MVFKYWPNWLGLFDFYSLMISVFSPLLGFFSRTRHSGCQAAALLAFALALLVQSLPVSAKKRDTVRAEQSQSADPSTKKRKKKRLTRLVESSQSAALGASQMLGNKMPSAVSDIELAGIYQAIAQGQSVSALGQTEALLAKAPNYKLLHLLRADLLLILSHKNTIRTSAGLSYALPALNPSHSKSIKELQQEAWLRLNSRANAVKARREQVVPRQLLKLADNEPFALVVDSQLSRLYVYQNIPNAAPRLVSDYYVTQGAQGVFKLKEGDNRTPIGTYFITGPVTQKLPDLYGYGALNIDYPNAWDKLQGRTGHGIWVHGTPSETYARAPYASNGCVVLSNPDVEKLFKLANQGAMPIVVVDKLDWVETNALEKTKKSMLQAVEQWRTAMEKGDLNNLAASYSPRLAAKPLDLKNPAIKPSKIELRNLAAIEYPGEIDMVVTRFEQASQDTQPVRKQLYWKKESGHWKIILENTF